MLLIESCVLALAATSGAEQQWGPAQEGVRTSLSTPQTEFVLGKPMVFRLEIENIGERVVRYDSQQVAVNSSMSVVGSDGAQIPYVAMTVQTGGGPRPLQPRERSVLFEALDIADQYLITSPGTYAVRFKGGGKYGDVRAMPASNSVTIHVADGPLRPSRVIARKVFDAAKGSGWDVGIIEEGRVLPLGRTAVAGTALELRRGGWGKTISLFVWVTESPSRPQTAQGLDAWQVSEPLGRSPFGDVYWWSRDVPEEELKTARQLLIKALEIEDPFHQLTPVRAYAGWTRRLSAHLRPSSAPSSGDRPRSSPPG
ncbi:MAG TPA: hypothetical protein VJ826_03935 [Candidatus Polarisedimenticolaceae bacterium]|nr:hypothetical protein [Candidatus Polarisedimenticolaceae bacterium]